MRDYIHVEDLGRRPPARARPARARPRTVICNLGTGDGSTVREVIEAARRVTGRAIPVRGGRPARRRPAAAGRLQRARPRDPGLGARALAGDDDRRRVGVALRPPGRLPAGSRLEQRHDGDGTPRPAPSAAVRRRRSPRTGPARRRRARRRPRRSPRRTRAPPAPADRPPRGSPRARGRRPGRSAAAACGRG